MTTEITLRQLKPGQRAVVKKVGAGGELGRRLREMGLLPGTEIQVIGRAPLKDPVEIKLRGYNLALRNNEADFIIVEIGALL
ncbi:MAG: ferrous iron transport protein A [Proteobacteria bacterium]|nr:ferrous iron transport protein A [Pseudomonadota bacterium]MBU1451938.1 ferrous iron transport protein A [Pseudomonadota bacterium]MBU2467081.1 ferrous iron transport protein A [Pseudomonadota bacterium]